MPQQRILVLDVNQLSAHLWQSGHITEEFRFTAVEGGLAEFSAYLKKHQASIFWLIADVAEEGFQLDIIPFVQGGDRRALIQRKLSQFFYGSPLTAAISLGREKTGRRDEKILFAALTRPQLFEPWLAALRSAQARLAGIYSMPLASQALFDKLMHKQTSCLLVSVGHNGIRQIFFGDGRLRFSRLSPLTGTSVRDLAEACAIESGKTFQYLLAQRLTTHQSPLQVLMLVHPAEQSMFAEHCISDEELQFHLIDLHATSHACGLKTLPPDSFSESLLLHLLVHKTPRFQFAPPAERRFFRLWQTRSALIGTGAVALVGSLLYAANAWYNGVQLRQDAEAATVQTEDANRRYNTTMQALPPLPTSVENLRALINRYDSLTKRSASPDTLLGRLSTALQSAPSIEIERIDWLLSAKADDALDLSEVQRNPAATEQTGANGMYGIAVVSCTLPVTAAADPRGILEQVNNFVALLRKDDTQKVTVLRLPFDIESGKALRSTGANSVSPESPKFILHISYPL